MSFSMAKNVPSEIENIYIAMSVENRRQRKDNILSAFREFESHDCRKRAVNQTSCTV